MRIKTLLISFLFAICSLNASSITDTILINNDDSYEKISRDLDSVVNSFYIKRALQLNSGNLIFDTVGKEFSDSVYINRLSRINSLIKLPYNNIIRNHIHVYTLRQREKFCAVLGLSNYYFPMIEDIFDAYGLPDELKYMAVIESALNAGVVSRAGATGLWQFMYSTGRMYGLTINSIIDERRDPVKATHAAARYLKDLYSIYNDWILVIAAYNCGPGNVNKAISRSGNKKDYWDIYYRLPRETRGYIPMFVAAAYAMNYYPEHSLKPLDVNFPVATDTIMVHKDIHLSQISAKLGIPMDELRTLNPQYKTGFIPGSSKALSLTLPLNHLGHFIDLNDSIRLYKPDQYLSKATLIADPSRSTHVTADIKGKQKIYYIVKQGDNLGSISAWYHVGLSEIRYWNNIYRNTIRIGQKLAIYVDPSKSEFYSRINSMSLADKQASIGKAVPSNINPATSQQESSQLSTESEGDYITHTVRYGDTIWDIVKLYGDVSATEVLGLNNISNPQKIQVGQKLKIKKKI